MLSNVVALTSGKFSCEVSADFPSFHTMIQSGDMEVVGELKIKQIKPHNYPNGIEDCFWVQNFYSAEITEKSFSLLFVIKCKGSRFLLPRFMWNFCMLLLMKYGLSKRFPLSLHEECHRAEKYKMKNIFLFILLCGEGTRKKKFSSMSFYPSLKTITLDK